jgi:hypothetical protein
MDEWAGAEAVTVSRRLTERSSEQPAGVVGTSYAEDASSGEIRWEWAPARRRVCGRPTTPVIWFPFTCGGQPVAGRLWMTQQEVAQVN